MTPENFCYWLQGYFELYGPKTLDEKETRIVWDHLNLVFNKITPDRFDSTDKLTLPYQDVGEALRVASKKPIC